MNIEKNKKTIKLCRKHTYKQAEKSYLNKIENNMYEVLQEEPTNEKAIEIFAKFLFERKKYEEALIYFNKLLEVNPNKNNGYYGKYKCYVMLKDYINSYKMLIKYINSQKIDGIELETNFILSVYGRIFGEIQDEQITETSRFLMNQITDEELIENYNKLLREYNFQNYSECIKLADECENICRSKNIKTEFCTLKELLTKANTVTNEYVENNLHDLYKELKEAIKQENYLKIISILKLVIKAKSLNEKLVYNSIYLLIKNNFIKESKNIIKMLPKNKDNLIIIKTLLNEINNQNEYTKMTKEQKKNYDIAIKLGHDYYRNKDLESAYYTYKYGEYTTNNNVFMYYIGKILYKLGKYKEAEEYLKEYAKVGSDKISKCYLYLAAISRRKKNYKKVAYYSEQINILNKLFENEYHPHFTEYLKNNETDKLKLELQRDKKMYTDVLDTYENEVHMHIVECFKNGNTREAEKLLKALEKKESKTEEDKKSLKLIKKNKIIYLQQAKRKEI